MHQSLLSLFAAALLVFLLPAQHGEGATGQLPAGHPPAAQNPAAETPAVQNPGAEQLADQQSADQQSADQQGPTTKPAKKAPEKPGIPVEDLLVRGLCGRCHAVDERGHMTRISYLRKSPEGWAQSIKRMGRLHGLQLTPISAKMLVRSLSNSHGLARAEAERGLYESERRVHWSEDHHDNDFKQACAQCHPLGRALLQHRDKDEWQLLRATHVAMFPLSRGQMGGGPPRESSGRSSFSGGSSQDSGSQGSGSQASGSQASGSQGSGSSSSGRGSRGGNAPTSESSRGGGGSMSVGDRVLDKLSKDQPLFTPEWEAWSQNKREVPLAGIWTVHGHETGRGDVIGTLSLTRTDEDEYDLSWSLRFSDGSTVERSGKGVLYAGYSWRGRSTDPDGTNWREVLLLDDQWQQFKGRLFSGNYDEIGVDVTLHRDDGRPRIVGLLNGAVAVPGKNQLVDVIANAAFPDKVTADDFFVGSGLTVTAIERSHDRQVRLTIDAAAGTPLGTRLVAYGSNPGGAQLTLYDTVDYVRVRPLQGLSRVGGAKHPRQLERFEAYAVHRGKDKKPYTDDDVDLFQVRGKWALAEFSVRDDDDDLQYVGAIDAATGVFTPNLDGPNPERKWQANNVGDVFVTFEVTLDVPVRPPEKKQKSANADPDASDGEDDERQREGREEPAEAQEAEVEVAETEPEAAVTESSHEATPPIPPPPIAVARETKTFLARSHLIVTIPIYVRWLVLDWEDR